MMGDTPCDAHEMSTGDTSRAAHATLMASHGGVVVGVVRGWGQGEEEEGTTRGGEVVVGMVTMTGEERWIEGCEEASKREEAEDEEVEG